jgi:phospholipid-binding lipoprotein MlaA
VRQVTDLARRLGPPLFALLLVGCASSQPRTSLPGGSWGSLGAGGGSESGSPAEGTPAAAAQADSGAGDLALEEELDLLETPATPVADPLGPMNRVTFTFNDKLYFWVLKPVAKGYRAVVPGLARTGVENFFNNLGTPLRFVSNVLQFKGREATIELGKFMINSTWGVLGFGNLFASNPETATPNTDLGLALAHHGVPSGPYVIWPFIGSYTLRDTVGWVGGLLLDPLSFVDPLLASLALRSYSTINYTSFRIGDYESLKEASIDPYLATRDAYLQYRAEKAKE